MATFEVTIDSADARSLRLLVAAEHWVEAWHEGLVLLGDDPAPTDASCVLDDLTAHIEVPSSGRTFVVRPLARSGGTGPTPQRGRPIVLSGTGGGTMSVDPPQMPAVTVRQKRPGPRGPITPDVDPVARILSELERQRLDARPIRIDSKGLPEQVDRRGGRRPTPLSVPRASVGDGRVTSERRTREETLAFTPAVSTPVDTLPQSFWPVSPSGATDPDIPTARLAALQWAVDTAWHHVPCALALLLEGLDTDLPEVVFARGERELETRGCRVPLDYAFRQVACLAPTRVRFADGARIRFVRADDKPYDMVVLSTLCAPVAFVPGYPSPATTGLGLVLLNSTRASGFIDSELRALTYLGRTLAGRLDGL